LSKAKNRASDGVHFLFPYVFKSFLIIIEFLKKASLNIRMSDFSYNSQKQLVFAGHVLSKYTQPDQNPFYLYSETILQEQLHKFRTAITTQLNKSPKIFFAMKANPSAKVIAHFVKHGVGVDVVSLGEIKKIISRW
jgi:diaminopimelate decarboxylase